MKIVKLIEFWIENSKSFNFLIVEEESQYDLELLVYHNKIYYLSITEDSNISDNTLHPKLKKPWVSDLRLFLCRFF